MDFNRPNYNRPGSSSDMFLPMDPAFEEDTAEENLNDLGFDVNDIGMSVPFGIAAQNVQGVAAKVRMGANYIDLQFAGKGIQGSQQQYQKPGVYGMDQRQALKELKDANELTYTTHASFGVMGLTGRTQQGSFSHKQAREDRDEIIKAIDFLADVSGGGSVTVHAGEFDRPVSDIYPQMDPKSGVVGHWFDRDGQPIHNYAYDPKTGRLMFKSSQEELQSASYTVIDERTGQQYPVQWNRLQAMPEWLRHHGPPKQSISAETKKPIMIREGDYLDYEGRKIEDPFSIKYITGGTKGEKFTTGRVPELDRETGRFKTRLMSIKDFEQEAKEYNYHFYKVMGRDPNWDERQSGRELFAKSQFIEQAGIARGWGMQYSHEAQENIDALQHLARAKQQYLKLKETMPPEEQWKLMKQDQKLYQLTGGLAEIQSKDPIDYIDDQIKQVRKRIEFYQQTASSYETQAANHFESLRSVTTAEKYWERYTSKEYAMLGLHALDRTTNPKDPIVVTVEHIFPEQFGGHPEELKTIIKRARTRMVEYLINPRVEHTGFYGDPNQQVGPHQLDIARYQTQQNINPYYRPGLTKAQAEKLAAQHIKTTFDTGHINMWRKYWQPDARLNAEQNDKAFNNWMVQQLESLAKDDMIGHIHLSDNFGFADEHLSPGQGNTPVKEFMRVMKKYGYQDRIIVEPGGDAVTDNADFYGLMKTWRYFGSQTGTRAVGYGAPGSRWSDVQHSYFGKPHTPYFIYGDFSPSQDWTLWSATPLE